MKPVNIVFFGSPDFSAQILESMLESNQPYTICGVVTNPDKPVGRKGTLTPSPVAQMADKYHLPVFKPSVLDVNNLAHLKLLKPDYFFIVAYGKIIPQSWLDLPSKALNIHFSLLPKYRGALCIQEALKNQDPETGVTLMEIDAQMDHGPIITQESLPIDLNDNVATLTEKLTQAAIQLIKTKLPQYLEGTISSTPQDHSKATFTPSYKELTRDSAFIPWETLKSALNSQESARIHALIRSLNPNPGAWTKIDDLEVKILESNLTNNQLVIKTVQTPGKNPISWKQFLQGHPNLLT